MQLGEPANKKTTLIVRGILGALALIFILAFANEIGGVLSLFWTFFKVVLLGFPFEGSDPSIQDPLISLSLTAYLALAWFSCCGCC